MSRDQDPRPDAVGTRLLSAKDAALYLSVSDRTLWSWGNSGVIPRLNIGIGQRPMIRYDMRDLDRWIEQSKSSKR